MKRRWYWLLAGGVALVLLAAAGVATYLLTRPNPHYLLGSKYLEMKEYDSSRLELKLCLKDEPKNQDARALLLYCHVRQLTEAENGTPEEIRKRILDELETDLGVLVLGLDRYTDLRPEETEQWQKNAKEGREYLRKKLREFDLYTSTWEETLSLAQRALHLVYKLKVDPDDEFDWFYHSLAASLLAYQGDGQAACDLIETAKQWPEACTFFHFAGQNITPYLKAELKNKESLLRTEGMKELRLLTAEEPTTQFLKDHPGVHRIRKADFKGKDRLYWDRCYEPFLLSARGEFLKGNWYLDRYRNGKAPLFALYEGKTTWDEDQSVLWLVGGYDENKQKFCGRFFLWDDNILSWRPLRIKPGEDSSQAEFESPHIFTLSDEFNAEKSLASIKIYRGERRHFSETETHTEQVTRYREETDIFGFKASVPYTTTEEVSHQVETTRDAIVAERRFFRLDQDAKTLEYHDKSEEVVYKADT